MIILQNILYADIHFEQYVLDKYNADDDFSIHIQCEIRPFLPFRPCLLQTSATTLFCPRPAFVQRMPAILPLLPPLLHRLIVHHAVSQELQSESPA